MKTTEDKGAVIRLNSQTGLVGYREAVSVVRAAVLVTDARFGLLTLHLLVE